MILIFSKPNDFSTYEVCKWLTYFKEDFFLIFEKNIKDIVYEINFQSESVQLCYNGIIFSLNDVSAIWYRRGGLTPLNLSFDDDNSLTKDLKKFAYLESKSIFEFLYLKFKKIPALGNQEMEVNKLDLLNLANSIGIKTPKTIVTSNKKKLLDFYNLCNGLIITKPSWEVFVHSNRNLITKSYTSSVDLADINKLSDCFFSSLFQEKIIADFELRVFYIGKLFFASCFLSQDSSFKVEEIDVRSQYSNTHLVPFKLPNEIEKKLTDFTEKIGVNTGSIDLLVKENQYYFLELNPIGQYDQLSRNCNYNIDKIIAEFLIDIKI
jgi:hypothetical protein